jgi:hypothetical protein
VDKAKAAADAKKSRVAARKEKARLAKEADNAARKELYDKFCKLPILGLECVLWCLVVFLWVYAACMCAFVGEGDVCVSM